MRILKSIRNDMKFQAKYGFYLLYTLITMIYVGIIFALPASIKKMAIAIIVFSDPAALGLFFMGAIILFEKSERVLDSLFISPLKIDEYIFSKVFSLSTISTIVGSSIALITMKRNINWIPLLLGLFLGSILFSLAGLIVASRINSLNQFVLAVSPISSFLSIPPFIELFGFKHVFLSLHPGVIVLDLILQGVGVRNVSLGWILILIIWVAIFWVWSRYNVKKMILSLGGVKL